MGKGSKPIEPDHTMYSSLTHSHSHSQLSQLSTVVTGARIAESVRPEDWVMLPGRSTKRCTGRGGRTNPIHCSGS